MKAKYDYNPLMRLYEILDNAICDSVYKINEDFDDTPDDVINSILKYNNCAFSDNVNSRTIEIIDDTYIYLLFGAKGNEFNEVFDYVDIYGSKYIIIFMDYFKNIKRDKISEPVDNYTVEERLEYMMGNSVEFDAICNIVSFFISLISDVKPSPKSVQEKINSTAPVMIAAFIINKYRPLEENDCESAIIPYNDIMEMLNTGTLSTILLGLF